MGKLILLFPLLISFSSCQELFIGLSNQNFYTYGKSLLIFQQQSIMRHTSMALVLLMPMINILKELISTIILELLKKGEERDMDNLLINSKVIYIEEPSIRFNMVLVLSTRHCKAIILYILDNFLWENIKKMDFCIILRIRKFYSKLE